MTEECPDLGELAEVMRGAESDPRRAHVAGCPRCRTQWALYQRFLDPGAVPRDANLAEARARISRALEVGMRGEGFREEEAAEGRRSVPIQPQMPNRSAERPEARPWRLRLLGPWLRPAWRPALGLVGVVVALVLVLRWTGEPGPRESGRVVLREQPGATPKAPILLEPIPAADGSVTLRWTPCPGADSYDVILFGTDLTEKARFHAGAERELRLDREGAGALREAPFCAVAAKRGGDEIARSDPGILEAPPPPH